MTKPLMIIVFDLKITKIDWDWHSISTPYLMSNINSIDNVIFKNYIIER